MKQGEQLTQAMLELSASFDILCNERHQAGVAEYGVLTFLENDVIRMMAEELADTANYCRMQFIKIMLLQDMLAEKFGAEASDMGMGSFKGAGTVGWT